MTRTLLCFAPQHNTKGRKDADEFKRQAGYFLEHHGEDPDMRVIFDNRKSKAVMRAQVIEAIHDHTRLAGVFFFCHGYRKGIQPGFDTKNLDGLAEAIYDATGQAPVVCFYSCDVARDGDRDRQDDLKTMGGDGGFCDEVRDALCRAGAISCRVDGHTTTGHTTRNPHVRRFLGNCSPTGGVGGFYIVPRTNKKLWKVWREQLRTTYRFDYPLDSEAEILAYLNSLG
jgi:hypothetical protein